MSDDEGLTETTWHEIAQKAALVDGVDLEESDIDSCIRDKRVKRKYVGIGSKAKKGKQLIAVIRQSISEANKVREEEKNKNLDVNSEILQELVSTMRQINELSQKQHRTKDWHLGPFAQPKETKFVAGELKHWLGEFDSYAKMRKLTDLEKIEMLKFRSGTYLRDTISMLPKSINDQKSFESFCTSLVKHISPYNKKEELKMAFLAIKQDENESDVAFIDKLSRYSKHIEFGENEKAERERFIIMAVSENANSILWQNDAEEMLELDMNEFGSDEQLLKLREKAKKWDKKKEKAAANNRSELQQVAYFL